MRRLYQRIGERLLEVREHPWAQVVCGGWYSPYGDNGSCTCDAFYEVEYLVRGRAGGKQHAPAVHNASPTSSTLEGSPFTIPWLVVKEDVNGAGGNPAELALALARTNLAGAITVFRCSIFYFISTAICEHQEGRTSTAALRIAQPRAPYSKRAAYISLSHVSSASGKM